METDKTRHSVSSALRWPGRQIRRLTYRQGFLVVARKLPFANFLRKGYQWLAGGTHNILRVNWGAHELLFLVHSPDEYRRIEADIFRLERYFLEALMAELKDGDVFLDVGSDRGVFVVPQSKAVGKNGLIIAFEPRSKTFGYMEANVKLNGLTNVRLFKAALGDEQGRFRLWCDGATPSLLHVPTEGLLDPSLSSSSTASGISEWADVYVGDRIIEREHLPAPTAVKIDVEGFEYRVIRGLKRTLGNPACKMLCFEIHPYVLADGITPQVLIDEVKSLGFGEVTSIRRGSELQVIARKGQRDTSAGAVPKPTTDRGAIRN